MVESLMRHIILYFIIYVHNARTMTTPAISYIFYISFRFGGLVIEYMQYIIRIRTYPITPTEFLGGKQATVSDRFENRD